MLGAEEELFGPDLADAAAAGGMAVDLCDDTPGKENAPAARGERAAGKRPAAEMPRQGRPKQRICVIEDDSDDE